MWCAYGNRRPARNSFERVVLWTRMFEILRGLCWRKLSVNSRTKTLGNPSVGRLEDIHVDETMPVM